MLLRVWDFRKYRFGNGRRVGRERATEHTICKLYIRDALFTARYGLSRVTYFRGCNSSSLASLPTLSPAYLSLSGRV